MKFMNFKSFLLLATLVIGINTPAQAMLLTIVGGTDSTNILPAGYNPSGPTGDVNEIVFGANLRGNEPIELSFEYLGYEAGWTNLFITDVGLFNNKTNSTGDTLVTTLSNPGWLEFSLQTPYASVANGSNSAPGQGRLFPNFFLAYDANVADTVYIGLNDDGSSFDADFDDLVVKVTARRVSEPASLLLLALALSMLGLFYKKRKSLR